MILQTTNGVQTTKNLFLQPVQQKAQKQSTVQLAVQLTKAQREILQSLDTTLVLIQSILLQPASARVQKLPNVHAAAVKM